MYKRYHIDTLPLKLSSTQVGKFVLIRSDKCLNCGRCITQCIYEAHRRAPDDPRKMTEPLSYLCKNCFACIQNCPQQALEMVKNEEFESLGNTYWTPQIIHTIWNEAEEGKIPVYGAGYRGPFKGSGFDNIWTDMSEIVRPTRDGIHGREYIATAVDLGRKLAWISDFKNIHFPNYWEIPIPMLFDTNPLGLELKNIQMAILEAAHTLGTFAFLDVKNYTPEVEPYLQSTALRFSLDEASRMDSAPWKGARLIEILLPDEFSPLELEGILLKMKSQSQSSIFSLGLNKPEISEEIFRLIRDGQVDILNFHSDLEGKGRDSLFIKDAVRRLHLDLVARRIRDEITIMGKGGIAAAEHVPKLIICGADAGVLDLSLLVAIGCRVCKDCHPERCPAKIPDIERDPARQRIINLTCAWRDQLLEILSAMGIRDVRRLRGEVGRAMFYEEIEKESFGFIFEKSGMTK